VDEFFDLTGGIIGMFVAALYQACRQPVQKAGVSKRPLKMKFELGSEIDEQLLIDIISA
jgi:hypothetical protein